MDHQIDHVARAFYDAQDTAQSWEHEPETLKEEFRQYARRAIALLEEHRKSEPSEPGTSTISDAA